VERAVMKVGKSSSIDRIAKTSSRAHSYPRLNCVPVLAKVVFGPEYASTKKKLDAESRAAVRKTDTTL
jgi:hypothetical protein